MDYWCPWRQRHAKGGCSWLPALLITNLELLEEPSLSIAPMFQKRGWCWLWEASCCCLSCWHWLPPAAPGPVPAPPHPSAAAPCRLQAPASTHALTTQTLQSAYQGITPFTTVTPVETPVFSTNMTRLWLAGGSNDSPWSLPRVNRALPAFKECHKAQLFPPSLEKCPVLLVTLSWCVTENVIKPLLLRHLRSLILHCHGKSIFGK